MTSQNKTARPVIFLMGATACGKTALTSLLTETVADAFCQSGDLPGDGRFELISVDAAQVYRGMDIGTAKPSADFLRRYPHHLIDIREPAEVYSAAEFCADAHALITQIHARGHIPLLTGGTMFYFAALENGLSALPSADHKTRAQLTDEINVHGLTVMHARLKKIDPPLAKKILPTDRQRIQRAMEIHLLTNRPPSEAMTNATPLDYPLIKLGLYLTDRAQLHARIKTRFMEMVDGGLVDEVKHLIARLPDYENQPAMRTVGYRQVLELLRGDCTHDEMCERAIAATRQLAKRQLTWMRRWQDLVWVENDTDAEKNICAYLRRRLESL